MPPTPPTAPGRPARRRRRPVAVASLLVALAVLAACSSTHHGASSPTSSTTPAAPGESTTTGTTAPAVRSRIRIEVLSSQPDRVTGGDARIRVIPPPGVPASALRVSVGDTDVTTKLDVTGGALEGVVSGFVEGTSTLTATAGRDRAVQQIRDWPIQGPMISGPHLPLLACSTEQLGLGPATDADCSAPSRITYRYVSTDHQVKDLPDPSARPADLATANIGGKDVPLIVREERGVINRSVYFIATIDPSPGPDDADHPAAAWNRRLVYRFGGGCGTTFGQGTPLTTVDEPTLLSEGYGVATATFDTFQVQCNDVLSAETAMMVKERFVEVFGAPVHTIGEGESGGAIQLHLLAQNYPGVVDGVAAILPFPDAISIAAGVSDCGLLNRFYRSPTGTGFTPAQRQAVNGQISTGTCELWQTTFLGGIDPTDGCDPAIPKSRIYDPTTNRGGIRCDLADANVNQLGRDPKTGFANRPLDNVGVQYGLAALNAKQITVDQFLALNREIGGYDVDGKAQAAREAADPGVIASTYQTGRVAEGGGDLTKIPIIDVNLYDDPLGDIHDRFRAFALRDRLVGPNGKADDAPGFQIWTRPAGATNVAQALGNMIGGGGFAPQAIGAIDRWLDALDHDHRGGSRAQQLRRTRPSDAVDNCIDPATGARLGGVGIYRKPGPCRDAFPIHGDARTAAGEPRADDILKCRLKAVDPADYQVTFTTQQVAALRQIFPTGVCDWRRGGIGQQQPSTTGRSFDGVDTPGSRA